jgi:putative endonuclease
MFYVYALNSMSRKYTYIGMTSNPDRRIYDHNIGYNKTTKPYKPFQVILLEKYPTRELARQREIYLKSGVGREYLKLLGR